MTLLTVTFDTPTFEQENFNEIMQGGTFLSVTGLLNLKWEEVSALEVARELGLHNVTWDAVWDDTPGTLTCVIRYDSSLPAGLKTQLLAPCIVDYDLLHD